MRTRSPISLLGLVVSLGLCTACGDAPEPSGAPASSDAPHWRRVEGTNAAIVLPDARLAIPNAESDAPRLIANVLADGAVVLKGSAWALSSVDEQLRDESAAGLCAQLGELAEDARERGLNEGAPLPVQIHADREAPWRAVRNLLTILRDPVVGTQQVQWAVRTAVTDAGRTSHRVDGLLRDNAESTPPALDVHIVADRGETWSLVRIFAGGQIRSFGPQPAHLDDEAYLRRAETTWNDLASALAEFAKKHKAARLEIRDAKADVWMAYVVTTVDLLFAAGFEEAWFPQEGLVLTRPSDDG